MRTRKPILAKMSELAIALSVALGLMPAVAAAQDFSDLQFPNGALALKAEGSFFVGGNVHQVPDPYAGGPSVAGVFPPSNRPGGSMVNQMYVQYQLPAKNNNLPPIVFVHGCCLSTKSWETTPDGRMGWLEYFVRQGFDTYSADQVGRARSGFDALQYQQVRYDYTQAAFGPNEGDLGIGCVNPEPGTNPQGCLPPGDPTSGTTLPPTGFYIPPIPGKIGTTNPSILIATDMFAWNVFRYGPPCGSVGGVSPNICSAFTSPPTLSPWNYYPRQVTADGHGSYGGAEQFPMQTVGLVQNGQWKGAGGSGNFFKEVIPDLSASLGTFGPNASDVRPTPNSMAVLAKQLGGAILVGHSQSSSFPTKAALQDKTGSVKGIIQLETGCFNPGTTLSNNDVEALAKIPMLIIEGDNYVTATSEAGPWTPQARPVAPCPAEFAAIGAAGGDITYIHLPEYPNVLHNGLPATADGGHQKPVGVGNSHMFMLDKNNLQIADAIINWIKHHVQEKHGHWASD
jgi:hypothetical protein